MARVAIALGSNMEDRLRTLREAVASLSDIGTVEKVSPLYETAPVGGPEQDDFLNAVVVVETSLTPRGLLQRLQQVERASGRQTGVRWGPRTLDLDIVAHGSETMSDPDLQIPHPRAAERKFVLAPLTDVWPSAPLGHGMTAEEALASVGDQKVLRWHGAWMEEDPHLGRISTGLVVLQIALLVVLGATVLANTSDPTPWRLGVGGFLAVAGVGLGAWAALALGSALTIYPQPRRHTSLVNRGPYRYARHPIYGAVLVMAAGACVMADSWPGLVVFALLAALFVYKSRVEERALGVLVPGYLEYRRQVRSRFLPFLW